MVHQCEAAGASGEETLNIGPSVSVCGNVYERSDWKGGGQYSEGSFNVHQAATVFEEGWEKQDELVKVMFQLGCDISKFKKLVSSAFKAQCNT